MLLDVDAFGHDEACTDKDKFPECSPGAASTPRCLARSMSRLP